MTAWKWWRRQRQVRPEIEAEAAQSAQSRKRAEERLEEARQGSAGHELADTLRELNASNGFAEALVQQVVRGSQ